MSTAAANATTQAKFAAGSDEVALGPKLQSLLAPAGGRWDLISSGEGLERSFKFKTFAKTWVSSVCSCLLSSIKQGFWCSNPRRGKGELNPDLFCGTL